MTTYILVAVFIAIVAFLFGFYVGGNFVNGVNQYELECLAKERDMLIAERDFALETI